jgi:hypothetical protein
MPPVGFEPTVSAGERPHTHCFDRAVTGTGLIMIDYAYKSSSSNMRLCCLRLFLWAYSIMCSWACHGIGLCSGHTGFVSRWGYWFFLSLFMRLQAWYHKQITMSFWYSAFGKSLCSYKRCRKWCPRASVQAWSRLILFANTFCRSAFGKSLCTCKRCWKYSGPSSYDRLDIRTTWVTTKILVLIITTKVLSYDPNAGQGHLMSYDPAWRS